VRHYHSLLPRFAARFLTAMILVLILAGAAWGQITGSGLVAGTLTDPNGSVVPGASVTIKNLDTGTELPLSSNEVGIYTAPFLQPGRYEITASKTGFAKVVRTGITLQVGQTLTVDLTMPLEPATPTLQLPPQFAKSKKFTLEEISRYDERGPAWYWNNFSCGEHTGTHFDAPIHWVSGKDLPNNAVDTIPPERFVGPAFVLDCSKQSAKDPDFLLTKRFIEKWEKDHARISPRSWVLMRTDWSKRTDPAEYQNYDETGQHTPGPDVEAVKFLVEERDVLGFGTESIGTDAGQAYHLRPPYPCHTFMHGAGRYGLQCLTNLDQLPPTGALVVAAPLKIRQGSGSPLRVIAFVEQK